RRAKRPHHVIADRVCHAAIGLADDRELALHGLVALFQRDAARRLGVDAPRGDGKDAADIDRHRLRILGAAVVLQWPSPDVRHERKSTRLNSSHLVISYAVFCLKKKKKKNK